MRNHCKEGIHICNGWLSVIPLLTGESPLSKTTSVTTWENGLHIISTTVVPCRGDDGSILFIHWLSPQDVIVPTIVAVTMPQPFPRSAPPMSAALTQSKAYLSGTGFC
jgi:hypothetical protein